jgi:hypothetical protein
MKFTNFFFWSYWFSEPYIARGGLAVFFWVVASSLFFAGIGLFIYRKYRADKLEQEVFRRFAVLVTTLGVLSLLWVFFRQQHIPFFAWRFWLVGVAIFFAWRLYVAFSYLKKRLPAIKAEQAIRERRDRYLPKAKK